MKATVLHAPGDIRLDDVPDPSLQAPTDALVRVTAACVCGSDLWPYRGINEVQGPTRIGHEFVGIVEEVGSQVRSVRPGDFVVAPFMYSDNTCPHCRVGIQSRCATGGFWGGADRDGRFVDGGQGEYVRVPLADGTLVATREVPDDALVPSLLSLSDVMGTGWHAAVAAGVREGDTVVVGGDGAVGLVVEVRGDEAVESVHELTEGVGADAVLECVGTNEAMQTAIASARPGATVGYVGVPHGVEYPVRDMFARNVGIAGGIAPARQYLPRLRDEVLAGEIEPGLVFDLELPLTEVAEAYAAMDERRAIKSLVRP